PRCRTRTTSWRLYAVPDVRPRRESAPRAASGDRTIRRSSRSGAWWPLRIEGSVRPGRGQFAGTNSDLPVLHLIGVFEQPAFRRPRGASAVAVIGAAVTRTHEQARLRKPPDRAAEVSAIDREHLELVAGDAAHPAGRAGGLAVRGHHERV